MLTPFGMILVRATISGSKRMNYRNGFLRREMGGEESHLRLSFLDSQDRSRNWNDADGSFCESNSWIRNANETSVSLCSEFRHRLGNFPVPQPSVR